MTEKQSKINKFLLYIENKGNKLPDSITLFLYLSVLIVFLSFIFNKLNISVDIEKYNNVNNVIEKNSVYVKSLISHDGIRYMFENAVSNFIGFGPVGIVLVTTIGISVADGTGFLNTLVKKFLYKIDEKYLVPVIILAGVMSNLASDAGYIMVLPLAGLIFLSMGKNPLIGIAAGFFGVSGGFSANLLIGSIDPLLSNMSTVSSKIVDVNYIVSPLANYYFMFFSTFFIVIVGTVVNNKIVSKMINNREFKLEEVKISKITKQEEKGLRYSFYAFIVFIILLLVLVIPENAILRNSTTKSIIIDSPFVNSIVIIITLLFFITGLFYGIGAKTIESDKDLIKKMEPMINTMGTYLILTFIASQFVSYFIYSNMGIVFAYKGASILKNLGLSSIPLLVIFILFTAFINLFIGSAVTKWSVFSNIFVPMFMILGISPELTQLAYRIGDSSTNIISPLMPFFGVVLAISNKFDEKIGMGSIISVMIPYSISLLLSWTILFIFWIYLKIPIGPNVSLFL